MNDEFISRKYNLKHYTSRWLLELYVKTTRKRDNEFVELLTVKLVKLFIKCTYLLTALCEVQ